MMNNCGWIIQERWGKVDDDIWITIKADPRPERKYSIFDKYHSHTVYPFKCQALEIAKSMATMKDTVRRVIPVYINTKEKSAIGESECSRTNSHHMLLEHS